MSHWQTAKVGLNCSMAVLKRALLNIMPEWESRMTVDEKGSLTAQGWSGQGTKSGFKIVVHLDRAELGFRQAADGSWSADYDNYTLPAVLRRAGGVETPLQMEVAAMKAKARAKIMGYQVISDTTVGDTREIKTLIPVDQFGMKA